MSFTRRDLRGGAVQTTISGSLTSGSTSCTLVATTGWPDGSAGPFYVVADPGLSGEEKILCSTRSGATLNFTTRGADGTTAASHASGAVIYPCVTAVDIDEANYWVAELHGAASATGKVLVGDGTDSIAGVAASTAGKVLLSNGTTWVSTAVSGDATITGSGVVTVAPAANVAMGSHKLTGLAAGTTAGDSVRYEQLTATLSRTRLRRAAAQSIPTATLTAISWDTEDQDTDAFITVTSSTVTIPSGLDGVYAITCNLLWASNVSNLGWAQITAGGVDYVGPGVQNAETLRTSMALIVALVATNTIQVKAYQGTGGNINLTAGLQVIRLGT